jgi:hypothetical protein
MAARSRQPSSIHPTPPCRIFGPITSSVQDTEPTRRQVVNHNAVGAAAWVEGVGSMNARIGSHGKFLDRLIPAFLAAVFAVSGTATVFWRDTAIADNRSADAIIRIDKEIAAVKQEQVELRRDAATDRQKTPDLTADVKVLLAITQRVERAVGQLNQRERSSP